MNPYQSEIENLLLNIDYRLHAGSSKQNLDAVMNIILVSDFIDFEDKKRVALKYADIHRGANLWLLNNLNREELFSLIEEHGILDINALTKNPAYSSEHLIAGILNVTHLSRVLEIVENMVPEQWNEEIGETLKNVILDRNVLADIERSDVLKVAVKKAFIWTEGLPDSYIEEVFMGASTDG